MTARPALKLVEKQAFQELEGQFWSSDESEHHSLHYCLAYPESFRPQLPKFFIERYSSPGDIVLDPFAGRGTTPLEAALCGRIPYASDANPLSAAITTAKLEPVDISEIALFLQLVDLRRPVAMDNYRELFSSFYDVDTYRELVNLRQGLKQNSSRSSEVVRLLALSLMHGHTAGYFSVYTFPQISLTPAQQIALNNKRLQHADYRSVAPRILRKAASVLRDGALGALEQNRKANRVYTCDARNLAYIQNSSVDLCITAPPRPGSYNPVDDQWLRLWFLGLEAAERERLRAKIAPTNNLYTWLDFMNEFLVEQARVIRAGGRLVMDLREVKLSGSIVGLDQLLLNMVKEQLSFLWDAEARFINRAPSAKVDNCSLRSNTAQSSGAIGESRVLVLRRV